MATLDFPKTLYSGGPRASRSRLSESIEASSSFSADCVMLLLVPRIAEVSVSMEFVDDAFMKIGCWVVTSGLGLNGTRSLSNES